MTPNELDALAERISDAGDGVMLQDMLTALGMVTMSTMMQVPREERMHLCVSWIGLLCRQLHEHWNKTKPH